METAARPGNAPMDEHDKRITIATTEHQIMACYPVMAELRPHVTEDQFLSSVRHLAQVAKFQLAFLFDGEVKAVAGIRISEWLAGGKYLEIEDLVSKSGDRSKGYGSALFDWAVGYAVEHNCNHLRLVSNVSRQHAHRFYLRKGMTIEAHYFSLKLK
jgi:GNAT superfamily N-acetyltransferase